MRGAAKTKPPQLIILDGATGSGKSSLLEYLHEGYSHAVTVGAKFTTRRRRVGDNDWEFRFTARIPKDHARYSFRSVGNSYAVNVEEIQNAIKRRLAYAVSCVNRRTTELLASKFSTITIYVYRSWTHKDLEALFQTRGTSGCVGSDLRREEVGSIAKEYFDKIHIYDHVILNLGSKEDMIGQFSKILRLHGIARDRVDVKSQR